MCSSSYLVLVGGAELSTLLIGRLQQHPALLLAEVLGLALPLALWLFRVAVPAQTRREGAVGVRRGRGGSH